jgi:hypothetical protein
MQSVCVRAQATVLTDCHLLAKCGTVARVPDAGTGGTFSACLLHCPPAEEIARYATYLGSGTVTHQQREEEEEVAVASSFVSRHHSNFPCRIPPQDR